MVKKNSKPEEPDNLKEKKKPKKIQAPKAKKETIKEEGAVVKKVRKPKSEPKLEVKEVAAPETQPSEIKPEVKPEPKPVRVRAKKAKPAPVPSEPAVEEKILPVTEKPLVPEAAKPKPQEQKPVSPVKPHAPAAVHKPAVAAPAPPAPAETKPEPRKEAATAVASKPAVEPAQKPAVAAPPRPKIVVNENITVKDLAEKMNLKVGDVLMRLLKMGTRASLNQRLDVDTAILLASDLGFDAEFAPIYSEEAMTKTEDEEPSKLLPRSPIVTIMGHVDHGKTSLLDAIRETRIAEKEAGGITQHIGAYQVKLEKGTIVFLDTPGHEAFTAMRARGAQVTDIVILVVGADDGVMPQTVEAIDHARAAGVPIIVAVNKIDLPQAQPERVKQELSKYQLSPEEWGGKTIFVEVSAKKRIGIEKLLEMILLEAELLELKANPNRAAQGVVVEARLDPKKGPVATILVQKGTLKVGDTFVCGLTSGKVKSLTDDRGHRVLQCGPTTPVEVLGFSETARLGERVNVVNSEKEAREIAERRRHLFQASETEKKRHVTLEMLSAVAKQGRLKEFNLILKADVQGSLEALKDSIEKIAVPDIRLKVIHSGVGGITESDVSLAAASEAVILGFSVRPEPAGEELARREGVDIKTYRIIYELVADLRAAMEGLLEPEEKEVVLGRVEVRQVFKTPAGKVAGCMVTHGKVTRGSKIRVLRDSKIVYEGNIGSLRRFKEDVREVDQNYECGIAIENFNDFDRGDVFEIFTKEKQARKLS